MQAARGRLRTGFLLSRVISSLLGGAGRGGKGRGAKEDALNIAVGEELVASDLSLKIEMNCFWAEEAAQGKGREACGDREHILLCMGLLIHGVSGVRGCRGSVRAKRVILVAGTRAGSGMV